VEAEEMRRVITDPDELRKLNAVLLEGLEKYLRQFRGRKDDDVDGNDSGGGSGRTASRIRS
jgi:hypothetical protein